MRVEHVGTSKSIPDSPKRTGLTQGDILIAEVTDIKGDRVFLKNQEGGSVLTAKLLTDIGVSVGDFVETVVDEASGGRYVLRVVDISRQMPFATEAGALTDTRALQNQAARSQALLSTLAMLKNNPGADPKAAAFLAKHSIPGTTENMAALSQMARGKQPVTALLAQIIKSFGTMKQANGRAEAGQPTMNADALPQASVSADGQVPSAAPSQNTPLEQLGKQADTTQTNTIQTNTTQTDAVLSETALANSADTAPTSADNAKSTATPHISQLDASQASQPDTLAPKAAAGSGQNAVNAPMTSGVAPLANTAATATRASQNAPQAEGSPISPNAEAQALSGKQINPETSSQIEQIAGSVSETSMLSKTGEPRVLNAVEAAQHRNTSSDPKVSYADTAAKTAADIKAQNFETPAKVIHPEQIAEKALSLFVQMDDTEKLAVHLKKTMQELPLELKELKFLIDHADNTVKEMFTGKFDRIEKQMFMMSEVKQFDCYQIPMQTGPQQQTTAELYVYKYRNKKKAVDPDNILILLGLDTAYMGRVETLIKTDGKSMNIEFNLEDMRLGDEMKADAAQLDKAVSEAGYRLAGISIKQLALRTTVLNAEERLVKEADGSPGNVDIRI